MYKRRIKFKTRHEHLTAIEWDSLAEYTQLDNLTTREQSIYTNQVKSQIRPSWMGCSSEAELKQILAQGKAEYVDAVNEALPKDAASAVSIKRKTIRSDYGDELCPHAVNNGNLSTAWRRKKRAVGNKTRGVEIIVNVAASSSTDVPAFVKRGAAALAIAQYLHNCGYSIKISGMDCGRGVTSTDDQIQIFPIKDWMAPLDILALTSVCCFPGFLRAPSFVRIGQIETGTVCPFLGSPMTMDEIKKAIHVAFPLQGSHQRIFIPTVNDFRSLKVEDVVTNAILELKQAPIDMLEAA